MSRLLGAPRQEPREIAGTAVRGAHVHGKGTGVLAPATHSEHALRSGRCTDPTHLTPEERLSEVGEIFAMGFRRLQLSLAGLGDSEAQCDT